MIPIVLNLIIYGVSLRSVESYARKSNTALINQIRYSLDFQFGNLENLAYQISQNRKLDALGNQRSQDNPGFFLEMNEAHKGVQSYMILENNIANDYYLIYTKSRTVANGQTIFSFDDFFGTRFQYSDWNEEKWNDFLLGYYHEGSFLKADYIFNGIEHFKGIIFVKTIPFFFNSDNSVFILFTIREKDLFANYFPDYLNWKGSPIFYDNSNFNILAEQPRTLERNSISIEAPSERYPITYGLNVPYQEAFQELKRNRTILILVNAVIVIFSFIAAFFFSRANANPLYQIYNKLRNTVPTLEFKRNSLELLSGSVNQLIDNNKVLESDLSRHKECLAKEFLFRLVKYGFETPAEMESVRKYGGFIVPEGLSGILLINLIDESLEDVESLKVSLMKLMDELADPSGFLMDLDPRQLGYLFIRDVESRDLWFDKARAEIAKINKLILSLIDFSYFWTMGNPAESYFNLNISYRQARIMADEQIDFDNAAVYEFRESLVKNTSFNLPLSLFQKILNLVRSGDTTVAIDMFSENWNENIKELPLSRRSRQLYFLELRTLLTRIDPAFADSTDFFNFHLKDEFEVYTAITGGIERVGSQVKTGKDRVHAELKEQLMCYLKDNYTDQNITLCSIATDFKKSESYISHIYKKYCGINFYTQLEGLRMEKAKDLLNNTDMPIKEVAEQSGYSTMHSFRRAFKKINGVSPSAYRTVS